MEDDFKEFDVSLYHLIFIGNSIERLFESFSHIIGKIDDADETVIYSGIYSLILINTISFLKEYNVFLKSDDPELKNEILVLKKIVKPAIRRIGKWPELNDFRNNALAHNLRDKKNNMSVFQRGLGSYDIPQSGGDLHVLVSCITMVRDVFKSSFAGRLRSFQRALDRRKPTLSSRSLSDIASVEIEVEKIRNEINTSILKLKKDHNIGI